MVLNASHLGLSLGAEKRTIFREVSCVLGESETGLLLGRSGSGKTAFGMAICGLLPLWAGRFELWGATELFGRAVEQGGCDRDTGIILENPYTQLSGLKNTVRGELAFPLECRGVGRTEMRRIVEETAESLGIHSLLERRVRTLSGGELQRALIACALVTRPRFLFLDRPLTEIDNAFRREVLRLVRTHAREVRGGALMAEDPWLVPEESFEAIVRIGPEEETDEYTPPSLARSDSRTERKAPSGDLLRVENVRFAYPGGNEILREVSFSIGRGDIAFISGPNGAGKTTLARILAGILSPSRGEISLEGRPYRSMTRREIASRVGFALQNAGLHLSRSTVSEELALAAAWGFPAGNLADILGLDRLLGAHPLELAQAERKRLAVALAAGGSRDAVILDEPAQYQDAEGFRMLADAISSLAGKGMAVLLISHDPRLRDAFPEAGEIILGDKPIS
jgi:energy-coupling factor transport system ATP-binding protein